MRKKKDPVPSTLEAANEASRLAAKKRATSANMSAAQKGRVLTPAHRANLAAAHMGKPFTPEHKTAIANGQRLRTDTATRAEVCAKMRAAYHLKLKDPAFREAKKQETFRRRLAKLKRQ